MRLAELWDRVQLVAGPAGRVILGVLLSAMLSAVGIGVAWAMYVFFGANSHATLLLLLMICAGTGAALGSILAWTRLDWVPSWPLLALAWVVLALAGTLGAWVGYQFGSKQEVECCVGPAITPITYTALGAVTMANLAALVTGLAYEMKVRLRWARHTVSGGRPNVGVGSPAARPRQ